MTTRRARRRKKVWTFPLIRNVSLFVAGLAGVFYETVFTTVDRPTLLLLYAAMLGLPAFLQASEMRQVDEREIKSALGPDDEAELEEERAIERDRRRRAILRAELAEIERRDRDRVHRDPDDDYTDMADVHTLPDRDSDDNGDPPRPRRQRR